jgi:hypothetical protein
MNANYRAVKTTLENPNNSASGQARVVGWLQKKVAAALAYTNP